MNEELSDQFLDFSMGNDSGWTSQKNSRSSSTDNVDVADSLRQYYHRLEESEPMAPAEERQCWKEL